MTTVSDEAVLDAIEGLLHALDLVTLVAGCAKPELAGPTARQYVESLTAEQVQRLACVLAIEAVWRMPLPESTPRTDQDILARQRGLQRWCWRRRQDAVAARRSIRRRVAKAEDPVGPRPPGGAA